MRHFRLQDFIPPLMERRILFWVRSLTFMVSAITLGALFIDYGYTLKPHELEHIHAIYHFSKVFYLSLFTLTLIFNIKRLRRQKILLTLLIGLAIYLTLLPAWFPLSNPDATFGWLWRLAANKYYVGAVLGLFAVLEMSRSVVSVINRRTNPALILAAGFTIIIALGTFLLLVPRSTLPHIHLSVVDALFVSTSAVCVTGLTPVDVSTTFTLEGQLIIALLIQIGGLGVMTITSFFALFFMGGTGLYNQFALRDMISSETLSSLVSTLLYILGFTFVIEGVGALLIWHSIHNTLGMSFSEEIIFSAFHSVSAFCNAGFSTLSGNLGNTLVMEGHNAFYLLISILVVLGGIGFPILVNFKEVLFYHIKMGYYRIAGGKNPPARYRHLTNINTKLVLVTTAFLLIGGALLLALMEWNGAFADFSTAGKLTHALFNSAASRTAGFNSVALVDFSYLSILLYLFLMWVGGGSQSTAGGIKVNTFAVAVANFYAVVRGRERVHTFGREIPAESVRRASAVIFGSIGATLGFFTLLVILEPNLHPMGLLFEVVSALSTVGSSLDVTALLGEDSKVVVSLAMFVGRIGLITMLMSVLPAKGDPKYHLPKDNVIIN